VQCCFYRQVTQQTTPPEVQNGVEASTNSGRGRALTLARRALREEKKPLLSFSNFSAYTKAVDGV
jgi:hypothetical protein